MFQHFSIRGIRNINVDKFLEIGLKQSSKDLDFSTTETLSPFQERGLSKYILSEPWIVGAKSSWDDGSTMTGHFSFTTGTNKSRGLTPSTFKKTKWKKYIKNSLKKDNYVSLSDSSGFQIDTGSGNDYIKMEGVRTDLIKSGTGDDTIEIVNNVYAGIELGKGKDVVTGIGNIGSVSIKDYNPREDIIKSEGRIEWFNRLTDNAIVLEKVPNFDIDFGLSTLNSGFVILEGITDINKVVFDGNPHLIAVEEVLS